MGRESILDVGAVTPGRKVALVSDQVSDRQVRSQGRYFLKFLGGKARKREL